ncbi:hypothetical protein IEQ34_004072 [Dendrobium chrysotoxum]|uniref:Uncharacterized protein n=1 Tax=Dendrobium chrysotoxum TaxID=161865 RepID=A0AAV7HG75_DENCH|nr:hypothetical protein IEQ34_004072 [Dendrobium chrysotoxum]
MKKHAFAAQLEFHVVACKIVDRASLASSIANPCPTHIRGPTPNGKKAAPPFAVVANLSGKKSCASSPHILRSCMGFGICVGFLLPTVRENCTILTHAQLHLNCYNMMKNVYM